MNSERRHELQQNDLAVYLDKINKAIEPYSKLIAIVLSVVVVGAIAIGFYRSEQRGKRSAATLQLIQASGAEDPEVLLTVSDQYPDTIAGDWARLYQGQLYLSRGIQSLFTDRENAEELLNDAQQALRAAISRSNDKLLQSRGQFGIARAAEALGNLDEAIEEYKKVIEINESEAMNDKAQQRIDQLSQPETKQFVSWFAEQDFSPPDPSMPPALPGSEALPDLPDLNLPPLSLGGEGKEGEAAERNLEGGLELPQEGTEPMTEETPKEEASESEASENAASEAATSDAEAESTSQPAADDAAPPAESTEPAPAESSEPAPATEEQTPPSGDSSGEETSGTQATGDGETPDRAEADSGDDADADVSDE